jgi:hypothetical protein
LTYLPAPRAELSFGDVCEAEFLFDVHLRADARALTREETSAPFAKKNWGLDSAIPYFVPLPGETTSNYVLGHGRQRRALVISDDCFITSALGREGGTPDGRVMFAPVIDANQEDMDKLTELPTYGRLGLDADGVHGQHAIVELRRAFMADARDIAAAGAAFVVRSLDDRARDELAIRWAAYALRRGKFVVEDNLEKFADLLLAQGIVEEEVTQFSLAVGTVAALGWRYEGKAIEEAGIAFDESRPPKPVVDELEQELVVLAEHVATALGEVRQIKAQL